MLKRSVSVLRDMFGELHSGVIVSLIDRRTENDEPSLSLPPTTTHDSEFGVEYAPFIQHLPRDVLGGSGRTSVTDTERVLSGAVRSATEKK